MTKMARTSSILLGAQLAGFSVMLIGGSVLLGWTFNINVLKSIAPNLVAMKVNTAICLFILGLALFLESRPESPQNYQKIRQSLASSVFAITSFTLLEYVFGYDFGIDQLLFIDNTIQLGVDSPGRMAKVTAICLGLSAFALILARDSRISRYSVVVSLFFSALPTAGYLFEVKPLYQVIGYTAMAIHTSIALLILNLGILIQRSHTGILAPVVSNTPSGTMARLLLLTMPLTLFLINWLIFRGELANYYDSRFTVSIIFISNVFFSAILILITAKKVGNSDNLRAEALLELRNVNENLERRVENRTKELTATNEVLSNEIKQRIAAEKKIHDLSLTDDLTGLLNRRGFFFLAEQALKATLRSKNELTLVYMDLDGLKQVNDSLGHKVGDTLIKDAAHIFRTNFRESDIVARIGGDEFTVLTLGSEPPAFIMQRLEDATKRFNQENTSEYTLKFSVGIVKCLPEKTASLQELLDAADKLMYQQKLEHKKQEAALKKSRPTQTN